MGTYLITPDSFTVVSGTFKNNTAAATYGTLTLAAVLALTGGPPPYPRPLNSWDGSFHTEDAVLKLGLSLNANIIALDGGAAISFFGLPLGFLITGATVGINSANNGSDVTNHFKLTFAAGNESSDLGFGNRTFSHANPLPNAIQLFFRGIGLHVNNLTVGQQTSRWFNSFALGGTYVIVPFTFSVDPDGDVAPGTVITISSNPLDPAPMDMTDLSGVSLQYVDPDTSLLVSISITATSVSTNAFVFTMPSTPDDIEFTLFATGGGVQFSGSVLLGRLTIVIADASGIYRIIPDKTDDTYYDQKASPVVTQDVKIPDPFFKTGFLP